MADLSDTLDALVDVAQDCVADSRRWRPNAENAAQAVSVEPVSFERRSLAGRLFMLEAELVVRVAAGDTRSQQVAAQQLGVELHDAFEALRRTWPASSGISSLSVREVRFVRPAADTTGGVLLILDVEVEW